MKTFATKRDTTIKIGMSEIFLLAWNVLEWNDTEVKWDHEGFCFHKSNIFENANSDMLEILINEYQVAFSPWSRYVAFWNETIQSPGIRHVSV